MKEWMISQGWPLYVMLGMTVFGMIGSILSRIFYGKLAKEAQLCGTSDYPMLHYIRQKYSSYYKLGMRPVNADALVRRYLALHTVSLQLAGNPQVDDGGNFDGWPYQWSLSVSDNNAGSIFDYRYRCESYFVIGVVDDRPIVECAEIESHYGECNLRLP